MARKISYMQMLKEAVNDVTDIGKDADAKGPMIDPILSYKGSGEIQTHKDAASILERYYFNEKETRDVTLEDTPAPPTEKDRTQENEIENGGDPDAVPTTKKDLEKELTEALLKEIEEEEAEEEVEEEEKEEKEEKNGKEEEVSEAIQLNESIENEVLQKLISEMESEIDDLDETLSEDLELVEEEVDAEVIEEAPGTLPSQPDAMKAEEDLIEEAFEIFKEQILAEEEEPTDDENEYESDGKVEGQEKKDKHMPDVS